jgi:hypothetical protein
MPAFSLVWRPRLDHSAASLTTRRSPTHPRTWTLIAPEALVEFGVGPKSIADQDRGNLHMVRAGLSRKCHSFGGVLEPR